MDRDDNKSFASDAFKEAENKRPKEEDEENDGIGSPEPEIAAVQQRKGAIEFNQDDGPNLSS